MTARGQLDLTHALLVLAGAMADLVRTRDTPNLSARSAAAAVAGVEAALDHYDRVRETWGVAPSGIPTAAADASLAARLEVCGRRFRALGAHERADQAVGEATRH